jgi:ABC-type uncharacterized transport system substrate-binding protein
MLYTAKRLSLGVVLILFASCLLLGIDVAQRRSRENRAGKMPSIAILQHNTSPVMDEGVRGMLDGLKQAGFEDGKTAQIKKYNAEGDIATENAIARDVTSGKFDLVITSSTPAMIAVANANKQGNTIHVFGLVADPFASGVGLNAAKPLDHPRHFVGQGCMFPVATSFALMKKCLPSIKRVGVAWNPAEANSQIFTKKARESVPGMGLELLEANVENSAGIVEALNSLISKDVQAIWVGGDNTMMGSMASVIDIAARAGIPVVSITPGKPDRGTLFELGLDFHQVGEQCGSLAGRILKGEKPETIPVEDVGARVEHKMNVNLRVARNLKESWRIPSELQRQANVVVDDKGMHKKGEKK